MANEDMGLMAKMIKLLEDDPVKDLARKLGVNRTYVAGYLKLLEDQGCIISEG